jgi:hypothetical protein
MKKAKARPAREKEAPEGPHLKSGTAIAAEALRRGVLPDRPGTVDRRVLNGNSDTERMRVGDPDDDAMANEYVGDETPGGSAPTPDQNEVDEIGRAYGLQDEDSGSLRSAEEVLGNRDRHRSELRPPRRRS